MTRFMFTALLMVQSVFLQAQKVVGNSGSDAICAYAVSLNGNDWSIATDSNNTGIQQEWFKNPPTHASKTTTVPWVIQDIFHNYHGVAWYWRSFDAPPQKKEGKYIIRFQTVDYMAEVWVNGVKVGSHEGGEFAFEVDITKALHYQSRNLLVVRVLNPDYYPIDNILLKETASSLKHHPYTSNAVYNSGGITGNVDLLSVADLRVQDIFVQADWLTGKAKVKAWISNTQGLTIRRTVRFKVSEFRTGRSLTLKSEQHQISGGITEIETEIQVANHQLWSPEEPFLYRVEVSVATPACNEELSVRFGFRDFRFENGFFRLNGKRIFLIGCNFSTHYPVGYTIPLYEEMLRRDIVHMKALGQNFVRIPFGCPNPRIFDIYDELGILVHQEHYGSWQMNEFGGYKYERPEAMKDTMRLRYERSISGVIKRDRNHPSIIMWGALNENHEGIIFRKAVELLPRLRQLDPTRMIVLNSGRFDKDTTIGSLSNPGSSIWDVAEQKLKDWHPYVPIPYSKKTLDELSGRIPAMPGQKIYISESGLCFPIDLPSELGDYQQWGKAGSDDAMYFHRQYDKFKTDWQKFGLNDIWATHEDYIQEAYRTANELRQTGEAAIRSNPFVVAYTPTNGVADYSMGESVATNFRRLKPALIPSVLLANSPLRWCLATEPQSIYSGDSLLIRASFSNLDVLKKGNYPATIKIISPDLRVVFEKKTTVNIQGNDAAPFAQQVLEEIKILKGIEGKYRLLAQLDSGGTAVGGEATFYVSEPKNLAGLPSSVVVLGNDPILTGWLGDQGIKQISLQTDKNAERQLILITGKVAPDSIQMLQVVQHIARGSSVIFLNPAVLKRGNLSTGWLPLKEKGIIQPVDHVAGYYRADRWSKQHPVFAGLPSGGMMDVKFYRNIIAVQALCQEYNTNAKPVHTFQEVSAPLTYPDETICGATRISHNYCSGVQLGAWTLGEGRFLVNTLHIVENLGVDPAADRLLSNMLRFAAPDRTKKIAAVPADWTQQLKSIGYIQ
ncbi:MAG: hypothetical protein KF862_28200 [Chitinophagaceae bacterium]|nr:hypothetical protein [Chitinophagaceae bacterium]